MSKIVCPGCSSANYKKNGHTHNLKQNHRCKCCGRQFVLNPQKRVINETEREIINRLLLERISLRGICRSMKVSIQWLLQYIANLYQQQSDDLNSQIQFDLNINDITIFNIDSQLDEMWSFVERKSNKQWIWIAMDTNSRQVIAFHVGDRGISGASKLWDKIPGIYKKHGLFHTDNWDAYLSIIPPHQHQVASKKSGKTAYIERLNCTIRQRNSRLVRRSLSFSKKLDNHIGSLKYFFCNYNAALHV